MYCDSYKKTFEGFIKLSGESIGIEGAAKKKIDTLSGGNAVVEFKNIDEYAKKLVYDTFGKEYIENDEGYIVEVCDKVTIYADSERAKLYGAYSVADKYRGQLQKGVWWNYPACPHRSVRLFIPPKSELDYFYKLVDMLVHLGYNAILLQIAGTLEFKRHPEVNEGWVRYCESVNSCDENVLLATKVYYRPKNAIHTLNGGGEIYSHEEMKEIVDYCRERCIEIIPEVPSLTHSEYFLVSHPELRECDDEPFASTCCPSNPDLHKLVFDFYDEVIDVFSPKAIHIGHDEFWVMCVCDKCKGKSAAALYAEDILKSYNYLKERGIETYMWGDKLTNVVEQTGNPHGGVEKNVYSVKRESEPKTITIMGEEYEVYDRYYDGENFPEEIKEKAFKSCIHSCLGCEEMLPCDITYVNWYYVFDPYYNDVFLKNGKNMIYGNTHPWNLIDYKSRFRLGAKGISISSWAETSEEGTQLYATMFDMGYGSIILWNHERDERDHIKNVYETYETLFKLWNDDLLNGKYLKVTHTAIKEWNEGRKFCGSMVKCDKDFLTMGNYLVKYKNGNEKLCPVMFSLNISHSFTRLERSAGGACWKYSIDEDICYPASKCMLSSEDEKMWYTAIYPLDGDVESVTYIPKEEFKNYVSVKEYEICN